MSGLLISTGITQVGADRASLRSVRRLSATTAAALLTVDCTYALRGRIAKTYLLDAVVEAGFIVGWLLIPV